MLAARNGLWDFGEGSLIKVIAELGINHNGDLAIARRLIDSAKQARAWGVKFQYRNLDRTYVDKPLEIGDEIVKSNIIRSHLSAADLIGLAEYARNLGLNVGTSFFSVEDVEDLSGFDFDFCKVPSAELTNLPLLRRLLEKPHDVLLSTGMSTEAEVEKIYSLFGHHKNLVVFHCVSNYPTDSSNARLGNLEWLRSNFGWRVGYSSHDRDWEVVLLALSLGPEFVERHLTLDKNMAGTDQSSSSEPEDFARLVDFALRYPAIMEGKSGRIVNQGERMNRQNLGRSLYLKKTVSSGILLSEEDFAYVSPQVGLTWMEWETVRELPVTDTVEGGSPASMRHFSLGSSKKPNHEVLQWARDNTVALPVRLHDADYVDSVFGLSSYEFHLSYGEIQSLDFSIPARSGVKYSVHLPDYVENDYLVDPFSPDPNIRTKSLEIFRKVSDFSAWLANESGNPVVIVCSLSSELQSRDGFYSQVSTLFASFAQPNVVLTLQWLPPVAWYFGGSFPIARVNSPEDIGPLSSFGIPLTMDTSHLLMGENAGFFDAGELFSSIQELIVHLHVAGAEGVDGEGLNFDFSRDSERRVLDGIFRGDKYKSMPKVLEVWQGHLDDFAGFRSSLSTLYRRYSNV